MKLLKKKVRIEIMFDATFWVAVSFVIFFGLLIYFKVPQNVNNLLTKMIVDIKNEIVNKSAEIKKNLAQTKISQMKDAAIKNIKDTSIKIAIETVKKTISNSVDKSKLDQLFDKNLEETKAELKKANS